MHKSIHERSLVAADTGHFSFCFEPRVNVYVTSEMESSTIRISPSQTWTVCADVIDMIKCLVLQAINTSCLVPHAGISPLVNQADTRNNTCSVQTSN